jgi:GNAT superfamily N-acetyltransferase
MQSAPNFKRDLNIVIEAPDGDWVTYCGMWYEPSSRYAYVEPLATDPDYRHRGLGRAALIEGIRRCGQLGAEVAFVGSTLPIYRSIGFREVYATRKWSRKR